MMREYARLRGLRRLLHPGPVPDAAAVRPVAPTGHAGAGARRPCARRRAAESDRRAFVRGARDVRDSSDAAARGLRARDRREAPPHSTRSTGASSVVDAPPAARVRPHSTHRRSHRMVFRRRAAGGCADGSTARRAASACPGSVAIRTSASSATSSTAGASRPTSRIVYLRLAAGLKLPGRGWLEFRVTPLDDGARSLIRQTATFDPKGVVGRLYWYGVLPLHAVVFRGLLRRIARRATGNVLPARVATVDYCSIVDASAAEVFRWHEKPESAGRARARGAGPHRAAGGRHP